MEDIANKPRPIEVSTQARKNLRLAFKGDAAIAEAGRRVYAYLNLPAKRRAEVDKMLDTLGLLSIAHSCLVAGETLEQAGMASTYGTTPQRRSWAAGRLQAAITAIAVVGQMLDVLKEQKQIASNALFREQNAYRQRDRERAQFEAELAIEKARSKPRSRKPKSDVK